MLEQKWLFSSYSNSESAILVSIWQNDLLTLKQHLKIYDPNKIKNIPALSVAKMLNRKECIQLLLKYKANQSFAERHDLLQSYSLFLAHNKVLKTQKRLADNTTVECSISRSVSLPTYGIGLIKQGLKAYYQDKNKKIDAAIFQRTKQLLTQSLENYFCESVFNSQAIFEQIISGKTTYVNSGWQGDIDHVIGVIFHKNHLIVGDGLHNQIAIYDVKPSTINHADIRALLRCPQGSVAHQNLINKITQNKKPRYQLDTQTQNMNCAIFSPLSVLQGLWYLLLKEKGLVHKDAANRAKLMREHFHEFMKSRLTAKMENADKLHQDVENSLVIQHPIKLSMLTGVIVYAGISLATGLFATSFAFLGLLAGFLATYMLSTLVNKMRENKPSTPLSKRVSVGGAPSHERNISKNDPHYLNLHKKQTKNQVAMTPAKRQVVKPRHR
ncbi:hypothetical protein [Candidatus Berkiella aquae]|uniref:Uncharacterized protein n=1 Tax=Candidatus Berkiella aquae TaxID=295108 RepID=A0A0Q9YFP1_9GAMM|nr:hypothetical protein [Candidatus Berkiella aquae]MCS5709901.1 hypothetical protein [Candidatus Berkiella aquae]